MDIVKGTYRGILGATATDDDGRKFTLYIAADEFYDLSSGWRPVGADGIVLEGTYWITDRDGNSDDAIKQFIEATGWDTTEEQLADPSWKPRVQVRIGIKPKQRGDGVWIAFYEIHPYDYAGKPAGTGFRDTMSKFRKAAGIPEPSPKPQATTNPDGTTTMPDGDSIPF